MMEAWDVAVDEDEIREKADTVDFVVVVEWFDWLENLVTERFLETISFFLVWDSALWGIIGAVAEPADLLETEEADGVAK